MGTYIYEMLSPDERVRVESEVDENFNRTDTPAVAWRHVLKWDDMAANRAAAMDRLGVPTSVLSLSWSQLFEPWRLWRKVPGWWPRKSYDSRPFVLVYDWHPFDPATVDAKNFLRRSGISIPDVDS